MKYQFHNDVRRALAHARTEANELGHDHVAPQHMLLGMLRVQGCRGVQILASLGTSANALRSEIAHSVEPGRCEAGPGELPYTRRAKKVLELAMSTARDLRVDSVGTEHLLLGLLKDEKGTAARILGAGGVTTERVEAHLAGAPSVGPCLRIEIDDHSDRSIYEQIVARVEEAVAVGEVSAGDRLPPVRRLADQLDIAPGTVARAYSELERLGVLVTEGARGTRVAEPPASAAGGSADIDQIAGLLRPAAVAAFHMGSGADGLRRALEVAMDGIFDDE